LPKETDATTIQLCCLKEGTDGENKPAAESKKEKEEEKDKADWKRKQALACGIGTP
jgi:hypothetical protein